MRRTPSRHGVNSTPSSTRSGAVGARLPEQEAELALGEQRRAADEACNALAGSGEESGQRLGHRRRDATPATRLDHRRDQLAHRGVAVGEDVALTGPAAIECRQVPGGDVGGVGKRHPAGRDGGQATAEHVPEERVQSAAAHGPGPNTAAGLQITTSTPFAASASTSRSARCFERS